MPSHILVIDDNEAIRFSLSILLQTKGYEVTLAADGASGIAAFRKRRPDIVISDMMMPGQPGMAVITLISAEAPNLPIIAMSGSVEDDGQSLLKRAQAAGANHCLAKPFDAKELLGLLSRLRGDGTASSAPRQPT